MTARIFVTLKPTVLDPQGQTICRSLNAHGHPEITGVRQGKVFYIDLEGLSAGEAQAKLDAIAKEVLANPVIEEYRVELQ